MISQLQAAFSAMVSNKTIASVRPTAVEGSPTVKDSRIVAGKAETAVADKASFSTLASQLNESALRAAKRDAGMTFDELGNYGRNRISEFLAETSETNRHTRAMEVPNSTDPELLDRAREASAFVARTLAGDQNAKNPFEKLSREQLNLVTYDDSGAFTQNERRAAWHGLQKMDEAWRMVAIPKGTNEQIRTGNASNFYQSALSYVQSLPTIERAVDYPKGVESLLATKISSSGALALSPTMPGLFERRSANRQFTLYDVLAGVANTQNDGADPYRSSGTRKFTPRTSPVPVIWTEAYLKKAVAIREAQSMDIHLTSTSASLKTNN